LVNHARKLGRCGFNLTDIPNVKVRTYRDTTGVKPSVFKSMLEGIEREGTSERKSIMGKRDYALLRLLWDNALRRGEIGGLTIGCFRDGKLWIKGKGHTQREAVDLSPKTVKAIEDWLSVRGTQEDLDPLFIALDNQSFGKSLSTRSIDRIVKKAAERVNVTKVLSPHRIRHSSITAFLDASGGDVRKAQKLSRHRQISTLMIYDDNRQGQQGEASTVLADLV
jgi:integrase/recombinase XerC